MTKMTAASRQFIDDARSVESRARSNTIVLIGDSITEKNIESAGTAAQTSATGRRGYFTRLNILMYQRFNIVNYAGVGGETTSQMLARFDTDVIAYNPAYVFIFGGANDSGASLTSAKSISNIKAMIEKSQAAGIIPIVATILPRGAVQTSVATGLLTSGMVPLAQSHITKWNETNEAVRDYAFNNDGVILIDWATAFIADDTVANSTTGLPKSIYTYDGVHPSIYGASQLARFTFNILDPIIPFNTGRISHNTDAAKTAGDLNNAFSNGLAIGTGGSVVAPSTGTMADEWRLVAEGGTIQGVGSKVARTDGVSGEWQRIEVSGSGAVGEKLRVDQTGTVALTTMGWVPGDTIMFEAEVAISAVTGTVTHCGLEVTITATSNENHQGPYYSPTTDVTGDTISAGVLRTLPIIIPAGATAILPQLEMATSAGGAATFDWSRIRCWKIA